MIHRPRHHSRRRTRVACAGLLTSLVLALTLGVFGGIAAAVDDVPTSGDVSAAATTLPDPTPAANNPAPTKCGLNMVLVLDRSGSTLPANQQYKDASNAFVDSFVGTPSNIGLITFAGSAVVSSGYSDVSSNGTALHTIINGLPAPDGLTNWQDAFLKTTAAQFTSPNAVPDLVMFITDGNPTTQNSGYDTNLGAGIAAANALKSNLKTHITGVGVGNNISVDPANIAKITGAGGVIDPSSNVVVGSDVYQPATPDALKAVLAKLTTKICGGTVHIHKQIRTGPNSFVNGAGWAFQAANADASPQNTDVNGNAAFGFAFSKTGVSQTITETPQVGYSFEGVTCDSGKAPTPGVNGFSVPVNSTDNFTCTVTNTPAPASITVQKVTTHGAGGPFGFNVSGPNTHTNLGVVTVTKDTITSAGTVSNLFPGVYTIDETSLPSGWEATGLDCGAATVVAPVSLAIDPTVNVLVHPGENVVCTFTNDELPSDLSIVKTGSDPVPVNDGADQQIDYTLTVDNNGPADAHVDATVTDMLPAGSSLVSVSPPADVTCDASAAPKITCTIPADLLEVADDAVVISISATVPTGSGTATNQSLVDSPDDPAPCTVNATNITCTEVTNNFSEVSTSVPEVEAAVVTLAAGIPVQVAAALAFTGSSSSIPFAGLGAMLLAAGAFAVVLSRRRRTGTATE